MKKLPVYLSLAMTVAGLAACEKELEEVAQPQSQTQAAAAQQTPQQLLTSSQWRQTDLTTTSIDPTTNQPVSQSMFARLKPAQRDNVTQFATDGRYIIDEGLTKVNDAVQQQTNGTYKLSDDGKTLTVTLPEQERNYTVDELSDNALRLTMTIGEGPAAVVYTTTYAH